MELVKVSESSPL